MPGLATRGFLLEEVLFMYAEEEEYDKKIL